MNDHDRFGHATSDARKRLMELPPNHDEIHAHADIDWTAENIVRGED